MIRWLLSACAALFIFAAGFSSAQEPAGGPNYALWDSVAGRAEASVDAASDANDVFERLRARIVAFRADFLAASSANSERIATLKAQISALGPVAVDTEEPADVAARRAELLAQLRKLQAPQLVADAAFQRADGLIGQIDQILSNRQTDRLFSLGPSPLNLGHWPPAFDDVSAISSDIILEASGWANRARRDQLTENLPVVIGLVAIAMLLLARGRHWATLVSKRLALLGGAGVGVPRFVVSLFRIILPLAGVFALASALRLTGLAGVRIDQLLDAIPVWAGILLGLGWLAERVFARDDDEALIMLAPERRAEARFYVIILALLFVVQSIVMLFVQFDTVAAATPVVLSFPITVLVGAVLFRFGQLLRGGRRLDQDAVGSGFSRLLWTLGTAAILIAVLAPIMSAIGYNEAANALLYPGVTSLTILGLVLVLQRFAADLYCLFTGQGSQGRDALVPVLIGFVLTVSAAPFLALAWGARVVDLIDLWTSFERGFQIGDTRISPSDFLTFALIFVAGYGLTRLLQSALRANVLPKTRIDLGGQNAIVSGIGYVGIFLAALLAVTGAGIDLSALALVAGALSVGIGFGLQNIVSNFVSGIILLIERPISEGDWIEVGGQQGYVRDISVRSTRIETFERTDVIVPNADLVSGTVTNFTRGNTVGRLIVDVGVAYGTDTKRIEAILTEIAAAEPMVLANPAPMVLFNAFGADALEFQVRMILRDVNFIMHVKNSVNHAIAARFAQEGIEIPFAQRDIWLRNPEALKGPSA